MLKLKLQHFGHLIQRADSLEKTLMLGKIEGRRRRGGQRLRWLVKTMDFPVVMYGCESWTIKKLSAEELMLLNCGLESPLDCKEIQPVHPNRDQSWVFIGRTDVEAETAVLWPPDAKS